MVLRIAAVRPYDDGFKKQVLALLTAAAGKVEVLGAVPAGSPDAEAARWMESFTPRPDAFLVPFHQHRDRDGVSTDGLTLLASLPPPFFAAPTRVLMPVSGFAAAGSFPRLLEDMGAQRPEIVGSIIVIPGNRMHDPAMRDEVRARLGR